MRIGPQTYISIDWQYGKPWQLRKRIIGGVLIVACAPFLLTTPAKAETGPGGKIIVSGPGTVTKAGTVFGSGGKIIVR
jgi:hypothetical protein